MLGGIDWGVATTQVVERGWARLPGAVDTPVCEQLRAAAPLEWEPEPDQIGTVRQRGTRAGCYVTRADPIVQQLSQTILASLTSAGSEPPEFNLVTWGRTVDGEGFITQHRDPPTAGGVIAVVTLQGRAKFTVWDDDGAHEWETGDGDLVLLRGTGWPDPESTCLLHEAHAIDADRWTLTLRHNTRGPDVDYFA